MADAADIANAMDALADVYDILNSRGAHTGHTTERVGSCTYCSCGSSVRGRRNDAPDDKVPGRGHYELVLADGFIAYRGTKTECVTRGQRHNGATVRRTA